MREPGRIICLHGSSKATVRTDHLGDTGINRRACAFSPVGTVEAQEVSDAGPREGRSVSPTNPNVTSREMPARVGVARGAPGAECLARPSIQHLLPPPCRLPGRSGREPIKLTSADVHGE